MTITLFCSPLPVDDAPVGFVGGRGLAREASSSPVALRATGDYYRANMRKKRTVFDTSPRSDEEMRELARKREAYKRSWQAGLNQGTENTVGKIDADLSDFDAKKGGGIGGFFDGIKLPGMGGSQEATPPKLDGADVGFSLPIGLAGPSMNLGANSLPASAPKSQSKPASADTGGGNPFQFLIDLVNPTTTTTTTTPPPGPFDSLFSMFR